jgi:hypothetical protein
MSEEAQFPIIDILQFDQNQRMQFQSGELPRKWYKEYPSIFDEDDLRLAFSRPTYHFFEWLGAICLYQRSGYLSLIEQYQFKNHKHKQAILSRLNFPGLKKAMEYQLRINKTQAPDLLVYKPDYSDWFFCEVKGRDDPLSQQQRNHFTVLSEISGKPIYLIIFKVSKIS